MPVTVPETREDMAVALRRAILTWSIATYPDSDDLAAADLVQSWIDAAVAEALAA